MRTDPPVGDDLTRVLAVMKADVLRRAEQLTPPEKPRRTRARVLGVGIALVSLLVVGSAGAALAAGGIPNPFNPEPPVTTPAPSPTVTPNPVPPPTSTPTPVPPAPAPSAPTPDAADPSTWIIGFDGVGPVTLGSSFEEQRQRLSTSVDITDPLCARYYLDLETPTGFSLRFVGTPGQPGTTAAITFGNGGSPLADDRATTPKTPEGIGIDSTKDELLAAYPDIEQTGRYQSDDYPYYGLTDGNGGWIVFGLIDDEVSTIQIANEAVLPNENVSVKTIPSERCPA